MSLSREVKEKISFEVIKVLVSRFESFPSDSSKNRNAPFHEAFLGAFVDKFKNKVSDIPFFISMSSWLQGLNTTLGQTFFENVAHILCCGEKREYTSKKLGNLKISRKEKDRINSIITDLSTASSIPVIDYDQAILSVKDLNDTVYALDFSADVFIEDDDSVIAIELKSVSPNSGEMKGEKHKILEGKNALRKIFPSKSIKFFIGFPFDPTSSKQNPTKFDKKRFINSNVNLSKFFHEDEILIASELWDFLSGEKNTMEEILKIINIIATKEFLRIYKFLNEIQNKVNHKGLYKKELKKWLLESELELIENDEIVKNEIINNKKSKKIYNQLIFNSNGEYNINRYHTLKKIYESSIKLNLF